MTDFKRASILASQIASGKYLPEELKEFLLYIKTAEPGQVRRVLDLYKEDLDTRLIFGTKVSNDFMEKLQDLGPNPERNKFMGRRWLRWAIAAAVMTILFGAYFYKTTSESKPSEVSQRAPDVVAPLKSRAAIILSGGEKLVLDSMEHGTIGTQGLVQIKKSKSGEVVYAGFTNGNFNNILINPRGSQPVIIVLSDGTKVWLNAESSLSYPVSFNGGKRKVTLTGEAYFEVSRNPQKPFIVSNHQSGAEVEVLGTHFDVDTYGDEAQIKVTLLEGAVKLKTATCSGLLKPGQQAVLIDHSIHVTDDVEAEYAIAWKDGKFQFGNGEDLKTIMKQVSRWYDVDVEYQDNISQQFGGSISRQVNISKLLEKFELTGIVNFKIAGKKIIVTK